MKEGLLLAEFYLVLILELPLEEELLLLLEMRSLIEGILPCFDSQVAIGGGVAAA